MITHKAIVKTLAALYSVTGEGAPTTATVGVVGDIYLDLDTDSVTYGNTYLCTAVDTDTPEYTWVLDNREDARIVLAIIRAERDYLRMRGKAFATDDDDNTVYPDGANITAGEMACYILGFYEGRGVDSEGLGDRNASYEKKVAGYPVSIVANIDKFVDVGA